MLVGRFGDTSGRPYFSAHVSIPLLSSKGEVSFVFDTGADRTVLMPTGGMALSVDYAKLSHEAALSRILKTKSSGVGGSANVYMVPSRVVFLGQDDELFGCDIDLVSRHFPDCELRYCTGYAVGKTANARIEVN